MSTTEGLTIVIDLDEAELDWFRKRLDAAQARTASGEEDEQAIIDGAFAMSTNALESNPPKFVEERLADLAPLIAMLRDEDWRLEGDDRERVLKALAYFADPEDLIPDNIPAVGYIDDAIMIEIVLREMAPELEAYSDFVAHREDLKEAKDETLPPLEQARGVMQSRMRRRRSRSRAGRRGGLATLSRSLQQYHL